MKLETINNILRPLGFILVVQVPFEPSLVYTGLYKGTEEPTKIYFMLWKNYLKRTQNVNKQN